VGTPALGHFIVELTKENIMELKVEVLEQYLANMNSQMLAAEGQVRRAQRALDEADIAVYRGQGAIDVILNLKKQAEQADADAKEQAEIKEMMDK
jgi:hypothetical protein